MTDDRYLEAAEERLSGKAQKSTNKAGNVGLFIFINILNQQETY